MKIERSPEARPIRLICSSCNETATISPQALQKLLKDNRGIPETICHCGGVMMILDNLSVKTEEAQGFPSINLN